MTAWSVTSVYYIRGTGVSVTLFASLSLATEYVEQKIREEYGLTAEGSCFPENYCWTVDRYQNAVEYRDEDGHYTFLIEKQEVLTALPFSGPSYHGVKQ